MIVAISPAFAAGEVQGLITNINNLHEEEKTTDAALVQEEAKSADAHNDELIKAKSILAAEELKEERAADPDPAMQQSLSAWPAAIARTDAAVLGVMASRLANLTNSPLHDDNSQKAPYIVESTQSGLATVADIFEQEMRWYCNPQGRGGTMQRFNQKGTGIPFDPDKKIFLGCGSIRLESGSIAMSPQYPSRDQAFGGELPAKPPTDATALLKYNQQRKIIDLPRNVGELFFNPGTHPVEQKIAGQSGTNPLAKVYYGAFQMALYYLVGAPPDLTALTDINSVAGKSTYVQGRAVIARQMLASYPFALMYADKLPTMGKSAVDAVAEMMRDKMGVPEDAARLVGSRIDNIKAGQYISPSEYKYIVQYQLPTSPGFYSYVNDPDRNARQLESLQTQLLGQLNAIGAEYNQWQQISAALLANGA